MSPRVPRRLADYLVLGAPLAPPGVGRIPRCGSPRKVGRLTRPRKDLDNKLVAFCAEESAPDVARHNWVLERLGVPQHLAFPNLLAR